MARSVNVFLLTFPRIVGKLCVKSAKKKTFASSSEIHKEFLKKNWLGESFGLVEFSKEYPIFFSLSWYCKFANAKGLKSWHRSKNSPVVLWCQGKFTNKQTNEKQIESIFLMFKEIHSSSISGSYPQICGNNCFIRAGHGTLHSISNSQW